MPQTDLSKYNNRFFHPGGNAISRLLWFYTNAIFFKTSLLPVCWVKVALLRMFGAKIKKNVVIKPCVNIKYPWNLSIGPNCWIGENVWIDSLVQVSLGRNVCLSQGTMILTGSHDYKKTTFDLLTGHVVIEDGVWIGAGAIINRGVTAASHAVLTAGSVATKNLQAYTVYQGNPAVAVRKRLMQEDMNAS